LNLPEIGPVTVAGLTFLSFREEVSRRVSEMLIGTQVSVTMGQLRTIRIFVLGDANRPGSYVTSSLSTISSALYRSGGISPIGSLRNVQLKRSGNIVATLDLYDLLLNGDTSDDIRLQQGDVIFVPPVGAQISVSGAVKRPAIYEVSSGTSIAELIRIAGGFLADAYPGGARIERIDAGQERIIVDIDANGDVASTTTAQPGDVLIVPQVLPELEESVTLIGHVDRPGPSQWVSGMRITDLIGSLSDLKPGADSNYVLIRRDSAGDRSIETVSADLARAIANPESEDNVALDARDTIYVFNLAFGRQQVVGPILEELRLQSSSGRPHSEVSVSGQVKAPGAYPREAGMRVSDLIRAGGRLTEQAYTLSAELVRYPVGGGQRSMQIIDVDLAAILRGDILADLELSEHDHLRVSRLPEWNGQWTVTLTGEVKFPGQYRIRRGETLRELMSRAGGLTDEAFPGGAVFLREALRQREQEQIEELTRRLEADLIAMSLEERGPDDADSMRIGQALLSQLKETEAIGRLVVRLDQINGAAPGGGASGDLLLRDGDQLLVPKQAQEVTIIGEAQRNTSHLYQSGLTRDDYIEMSGGLTRRADKKLIYVVRANGEVVSRGRSKWFARGDDVDVMAGDTIVVPMATDRFGQLTFWGNVTQILFQSAVAVAAVNSF
jgi:protein involved in polysaccharide export with SLBB domain